MNHIAASSSKWKFLDFAITQIRYSTLKLEGLHGRLELGNLTACPEIYLLNIESLLKMFVIFV